MTELKNTKRDYVSGEVVQFATDINKPIRVKMDERLLTMILNFLFKDKTIVRSRRALKSVKELFDHLDDTVYEDKYKCQNLIWLIRKVSTAILSPDCGSMDSVIITVKDDIEFDDDKEELLDKVDPSSVSYEDCRTIVTQIDDRLRFGYVGTTVDTFKSMVNKIDLDDYKSFRAIDNDLYQYAVGIVNAKRNTSSLDAEQTFSLQDGQFETVVTDALERLKDTDKVFRTGIRRWNTLLGGAYLSKKLYVYLALPAGGKSQILLKSALDIKKYNPNIQAKNPDKRPAILLITMENDIDETIERIFNMSGSDGNIRDYSAKQVIQKLRIDGSLSLKSDNSFDIIIKYYPNRSIDTNDLYTIVKDINDSGEEVEVLILDYLKRIKPSERAKDEKEELKNITNELKTLAKLEDICVITAQQLNRSAAATIDNAMRDNKTDATKLIGRENVGSAWEIIENADWSCIINPDKKQGTDEPYLDFKLIKRRYRSFEASEELSRMTYFTHPYDGKSSCRLIDDINLDKSVSCSTLSVDLVANPGSSPKFSGNKDSSVKTYPSISEEFSIFDPDNQGDQW